MEFLDVSFTDTGEIVADNHNIEGEIERLVDLLGHLNTGAPLRSREISLAITALEEAGLWLLKDRINRQEKGQ